MALVQNKKYEISKMMDKIKVIFLDIDGVLRPVTGNVFNDKCINNLNELIKITDAKIVISSTWRQRGIDDVREFLYNKKVVGDIIDITPIFTITKNWGKDWEKPSNVKPPRGMEIQEWIRDYTNMDRYVESYVIIDDSEDMLLSQLNHYVKVEQTKGFDKKCLKKSIDILSVIDFPTI